MKACTADVESGEEKKGRSRKEHRRGEKRTKTGRSREKGKNMMLGSDGGTGEC